MNLIIEALGWLQDHWKGPQGVALRLMEHIQISLLSVLLASLIAIPAGLYIGHTRKGEFIVTSLVSFGRAIPSFAILAMALPLTIRLGLGLGFWPTVIALFALAVAPILSNAFVGVRTVDPEAVEAAVAMGMTGRQVLVSLELPLAARLIVAGLRTATVQVVATATLAALVAWGGLGRFIIDGFAIQDNAMILAGAILVALLAIATELLFEIVERTVTPQLTGGSR